MPLLPRSCRSYESRNEATASPGFGILDQRIWTQSKIANLKSKIGSGKARRVGSMLEPGDLSALPQPAPFVGEGGFYEGFSYLAFLRVAGGRVARRRAARRSHPKPPCRRFS